MNMLLSMLVCIAMLFSGGAALPAQPETADVLTLSNITLTIDDQTIALNPSLEITSQIGSEAAGFHFEVKDADGASRLPVSASLDQNGVTLALGDSERAYHYSAEALEQLLGLTIYGDISVLDNLSELMQSYAALLELAKDPEAAAQLNVQTMQIFAEKFGDQFAATQVDLNGEMLDGVEGDIEINSAALFEMMDDMCKIEGPLADYLNAMLAYENQLLSDEATVNSYAELYDKLSAEIDDFSMPIHLLIAGNDKATYSSASLNISDPDTDTAVNFYGVSRIDENGGEMNMQMVLSDGAGSYGEFTFTVNFEGAPLAPTMLDVKGTLSVHDEQSWDVTDEGDAETAVTHTYADDTAVDFTLTSATDADGVKQTQILTTVGVTSNAGTDEAYEERVELRFDRTTHPEENGTAASQSFELNVDGEQFGLSYEARHAQHSAEDLFAGRKIVEMSDENGEQAMNQLTTDAYSLIGDLNALSTDESIAQLLGLFGTTYTDEYDNEDAIYVEDTPAADAETAEESMPELDSESSVMSPVDEDTSVEEQTVTTLEEAAAIYQGSIPAFTAPDGYTIREIWVSDTNLYVEYTCEDQPDFQLQADTYTVTESYYTFKDGALQPVDGLLVSTDLYDDGTVFSIDVLAEDGGMLTFYFDDATLEEATAVLAGLN